MKKIGIFGSSGFARETADICRDIGYERIVFIEKDSLTAGAATVSESEVHALAEDGWVFAIGIGDNSLRKKIAERFSGLPFPNIIHSSVTMGESSRNNLSGSKGNILCAGSRLTCDVTIGDFNIINLNATVTHDCVLESFIHVSPGANISGNVFIGEKTMIGTNAAVINGRSSEKRLTIGREAVIGIGALVMSNIKDGEKAIRLPEH